MAVNEFPPPPHISRQNTFIPSPYNHKPIISQLRSNPNPSQTLKSIQIGSRKTTTNMVSSMGPGKFYGSSLPRPRIYTDVKYNHERVDPPTSVMDPFLSWANEAHWSMGGLCTKRLRLQGRIEGNISKLRAQNEKFNRKQGVSPAPVKEPQEKVGGVGGEVDLDDDEADRSVITPMAPVAVKRKRRFMDLIDEDEEEVRVVVEVAKKKKKPARKLINEFNSVADSPIRRSPRSGGGGKSIGGSFVSKMKKAAESLRNIRSCGDGVLNESRIGIDGELSGRSTRASPRLSKTKM